MTADAAARSACDAVTRRSSLAILRLLLGGLIVFVAMLVGLGGLTVWPYHAYTEKGETSTV